MRAAVTLTMNLPTGKSLQVTWSAREWAEMNQRRYAMHQKDRRARVAELRKGSYACMGTDHPALLSRELTYDHAVARARGANGSSRMADQMKRKGHAHLAAHEQRCADRDLAQAKALALAYMATIQAAKNTRRFVAASEAAPTVVPVLTDTHTEQAEAKQAPPDRQLFTHADAALMASADAGEAPPAVSLPHMNLANNYTGAGG
jgi:hypothetical protein